MDPTTAVELSRNTLWQGLLIGGPLLAVLLLVGIVTAVAQTVTNVHDVSVSFIPKLLVLGAALILGMPWMMSALAEYTRTALGDGVRAEPARLAWSMSAAPPQLPPPEQTVMSSPTSAPSTTPASAAKSRLARVP